MRPHANCVPGGEGVGEGEREPTRSRRVAAGKKYLGFSDAPTLRPFSTASFISRTTCSRPGSGRWRKGGGASLAASRTSHWFQPAKTKSRPPRVNLLLPFVRTKASEGRQVVRVTWSSSARFGSRALCIPP